MYSGDDVFVVSLVGVLSLVLAAGALYRWMRYVSRVRAEQLRVHGYQLIHALKAYSAWIEYQRDLPFTARSLDELTSPEPLTRARRLKREYFPSLSPHMVRLLQAHSHVIEYLWQQNLLRLSQGSGWRPAYEDPQYQQIRGAQEDLIGEMIDICRELTGDAHRPWRQTGSDFSFTNGLNVSRPGPTSRA